MNGAAGELHREDGAGGELRSELERRFVTVEELFTIAGREITIVRPRSAEDLISEDDFARDERLPYWADVWPSATMLAELVLEANDPPERAIELGCGVGLVTVAATLRGVEVLATDYYDDALAFTRLNALLNEVGEPETLHVDWRSPPKDLERFPVVLAADVLYERPYATVVPALLERLLERDGVAVVADPGRAALPEFLEECERRGLAVHNVETRDYRSAGIRQTISIYFLSRSASSSRAFTSTPQR